MRLIVDTRWAKGKKRNRRKTVTGIDDKIAILVAVTHDPHVSSRQPSHDTKCLPKRTDTTFTSLLLG